MIWHNNLLISKHQETMNSRTDTISGFISVTVWKGQLVMVKYSSMQSTLFYASIKTSIIHLLPDQIFEPEESVRTWNKIFQWVENSFSIHSQKKSPPETLMCLNKNFLNFPTLIRPARLFMKHWTGDLETSCYTAESAFGYLQRSALSFSDLANLDNKPHQLIIKTGSMALKQKIWEFSLYGALEFADRRLRHSNCPKKYNWIFFWNLWMMLSKTAWR